MHVPAWREGDKLEAQHFQSLHEEMERLRSRLLSLYPYSYGVAEVRLDDSRLQDKSLSLWKISAIFRDGTVIDEDCNVEVSVPEEGDSWQVYVGVASKERDYSMRYKEYLAEIPDWHQPQPKLIQCIRHRLYLFVDEKPPPGYSCLPIARIFCKRLDQNYCPPLLSVNTSTLLYPKLSGLISFLRDKMEAISKDHPSFAGLMESIIEIEVMVRASFHPRDLYLALSRLYAKSSALRLSKNVPHVLPYQHEDISYVYDETINRIKHNMSSVRDVNSVSLEKSGEVFSLQLKPEHQFRDRTLALGIEFSGKSSSEMAEWLKEAVIEGIAGEASTQRVLGASRKAVGRISELGLEERSDLLLAEVMIDETYLGSGDQISLYNRSSQAPERIKLFFHPHR